MYSRSYGSIETERKNDGISIPANYNGSLYPPGSQDREERKKTEAPPENRESVNEQTPPMVPEPEVPSKRHASGIVGGLLEKFTAEDIILFVLVFSLLKDENEDPGTILSVILALLLL